MGAEASEISFSEFIDCSEDEARKFISDKDLGYVKSLSILLSTTYDSLVNLKETYISRSLEEEKSGNKTLAETFDKATERVFAELFKIEHKARLLNDYISSIENSGVKDNSDLTNET